METFLALLVLFIGSLIYAIYKQRNKTKQRKSENSEELIIIREEKNNNSGELTVNLSLAPGGYEKIKQQFEHEKIGFSAPQIDKNTIIADKPKEYPLREKIYISPEEFRFEGEEDYIIRLEQFPPTGFNNKIFEKVMIKGISYLSREELISSFISGSNRSLTLERSPSKRDKFGIKVIGGWRSIRKIRQAHLGWVPILEAAQIYTSYPPDIPLAATLRKIYKPRPFKNPGMRYDIWIP